MKNQIVLLGHTGFIGSNIFKKLKLRGMSVKGIDRDKVNLLNGEESASCLSEILTSKSTLIITTAINRELGDNLKTLQGNIKIIANIAQVLESKPIKKCVYLSTADVYGIPEKLPITEETPISPQTYYAIAKYCCEALLEVACRKTNCPLLILRYNGVFGPGQRNIGYGPNAFIKSVLDEGVVRLWGKGEELRDTLYVKDLAKVISQLSLGRASGVYNIATGKSRTFADMVRTLQKISPKRFKVLTRKRTGPAFDQVFDIARLAKAIPRLSFTPMEQALLETYQTKSTSIE